MSSISAPVFVGETPIQIAQGLDMGSFATSTTKCALNQTTGEWATAAEKLLCEGWIQNPSIIKSNSCFTSVEWAAITQQFNAELYNAMLVGIILGGLVVGIAIIAGIWWRNRDSP